MLRTSALAALLVSFLAGCERGADHPALRAADLPSLVPTYRFVFDRSEPGNFRFSPDGDRLAWSGPYRWSSALHVRNPDGKVHVYRVGGSGTYWSADGRRLLILDDKSGAENHHLYRLDVDDPDATPHDLTPYPGVRVWLYRILDSDPEHVLVLHNRRDRNLRDLYRLNLSTGAEELIAANPGDGIVPVTDAVGNLVAWRTAKAAAARARGKPRPPELKERSALSRKSEDVTRTVGISPDGAKAWVLTNQGRDRVALFEVDTASRRARLVHEEAEVDVSHVVTSRRTGKPLLVGANADYPRVRILDAELAADLAPILKRYQGTRVGFDIASMDAAEQRLVVVVYSHASRHYYLLDRARGVHLRLDKDGGGLEAALTVPEAVQFRARDGMLIPAYLVRPRGTGNEPLPLVVLVHGGPWARVAWSDPAQSEDLLRAHFLANRGYAVLAINFRGSVGYGRSFTLAAVGEMGARMQDDLVDGVEWAIEAGIAEPSRIAVMGHSYGGYATLMALAREPQRFACGVDISGPTDLAALVENFPPYWELELDHWYSYVGDPAVPADRSRMQATSPINLAQRIERPLLILHGRNDVRVRVDQAQRMAEALRREGKPVRLVLIPEMGHSTGYWAHHLLVLRETEAFLAECLGGRAARFDPLEWAARLSGRLPLFAAAEESGGR